MPKSAHSLPRFRPADSAFNSETLAQARRQCPLARAIWASETDRLLRVTLRAARRSYDKTPFDLATLADGFLTRILDRCPSSGDRREFRKYALEKVQDLVCAQRAQGGDPVAKAALSTAPPKLVIAELGRWNAPANPMWVAALIAEALDMALEGFDPMKGFWKGYLVRTIRNAVLKAVKYTRPWMLKDRDSAFARKLAAAENAFIQAHSGGEPSAEDLSAILGVSVAQVRRHQARVALAEAEPFDSESLAAHALAAPGDEEHKPDVELFWQPRVREAFKGLSLDARDLLVFLASDLGLIEGSMATGLSFGQFFESCLAYADSLRRSTFRLARRMGVDEQPELSYGRAVKAEIEILFAQLDPLPIGAADWLADRIAALSTQRAAVFALRIAGLKHEKIAKECGITTANARQYYSTTFRSLAAEFALGCDDPGMRPRLLFGWAVSQLRREWTQWWKSRSHSSSGANPELSAATVLAWLADRQPNRTFGNE